MNEATNPEPSEENVESWISPVRGGDGEQEIETAIRAERQELTNGGKFAGSELIRKLNSETDADIKPNPFDPARLRLSHAYLNREVTETLIDDVPVRKPGKQEFFRVHPSHQMDACGLLTYELTGEKYLVDPVLVERLDEKAEELCIRSVSLYLCISRQKDLFLWDVGLPHPDKKEIKWHTTARNAAREAQHFWIKLVPKQSAGKYLTERAIVEIDEPKWPTMEFPQILKVAFENHYIDSMDHIVIKKIQAKA
jgi:hypothetical protein